jgi:histone H3/H4
MARTTKKEANDEVLPGTEVVEVVEAEVEEKPARVSATESSAVQTPLETYLREINETALLSAEEEQMLAGPDGPSQPPTGR